ncbi:MAG TPA: thioredoxin domain-containing protein [Candidatus Polarisedimenticolia bacterium]|nr:thioredoxin domain-containing protein [Candidatus Polarisedimenticolia bacterium]
MLVDSSAGWCGSCKHLAPVVAASAEEYAGRPKSAHLDIDDRPSATAAHYGVRSVSTLLVLKGAALGSRSWAMSRRKTD